MAALDTVIIVACGYIAMLTRFAPEIQSNAMDETNSGIIRLLVSYLAVFTVFGMYKVRWRAMTMSLLFRQALGCVVGMGVSLVWEELLNSSQPRRYYLLIAFAFILGGICGFRLIMKLLRDYAASKRDAQSDEHTSMTISAGESGNSISISVQGRTVKGGISDIDAIAAENGVNEILICLSSPDAAFIAELTSACLSTGCFVKRI